jgi:hypothetical protein
MAKQTILSKDFFVDAPDQPLKQTILSIPQFIDSIKFIGENTLSESVKFLYEDDSDTHEVTVALRPLTCEQTRVALHVNYADKNTVQNQKQVQNVLDNFESAIHATLNGRPEEFQPKELKRSSPIRFFNFVTLFVAFLGLLFLWKKMS